LIDDTSQPNVAAMVSDMPTDAEFRSELRAFAQTRCPAETRRKVAANIKLGRDDIMPWQRALHARGWGAPGWPKAHGGTGWDANRRYAFEEVLAECDCPPQPLQGLRHIGPVLITFGTLEQKARYLPRIIAGEDWWCQGFSEPGAGSDLAALKARAERTGDDYLVNGQKLWTSHAHEADMMFALVRTSIGARKQDGISMLLIRMNLPGITIRPIVTIDGWHHVNEVFFDDVRVPVADRVGDEGMGWQIAKFLLNHERLGPLELLPPARRLLQRTRAMLAADAGAAATSLQSRLLRAEVELEALREIGLLAIDDLMHGRPIQIEPSILKLGWSQTAQDIGEAGFDAAAPHQAIRLNPSGAVPDDADSRRAAWLQNFLYQRAFTIFGGSSEVQRNILARHLFGS